MRAVTGQQRKSSKLPPLVTEHKQCIGIGPSDSMSSLPCKTMVRCKQPLPVPTGCYSPVDIIPSDSQLLRMSQFRTKGGQLCTIWGIPWSEDEFIFKAIERGHPRSFVALVPPAMEEAISCNAYMSSEELVKIRAHWFSSG